MLLVGKRRSGIVVLVLALATGTHAWAAMQMNGLLLEGGGMWYWNGKTHVNPLKITNVSGKYVGDVRVYVTGHEVAGWDRPEYEGNGRWEKEIAGVGLELKVSGPRAVLPDDQERNVPPGEALDAKYPYVRVGGLQDGETEELVVKVKYKTTGGATYGPPYKTWMTLASGGTQVSNRNRPPTAYDQQVTTEQDTPVEITLEATDPDGDELGYEPLGSPSSGSLNIVGPLSLVYTPHPGYVGQDSFDYIVYDERGNTSEPATVFITVGGTASTGLLEDFEDGDFTSDPEWTIFNPGYGTLTVTADPVRQGNLVLQGNGGEQGGHGLRTPISVAYSGFEASMEFLVTDETDFGPALTLRNGTYGIQVRFVRDEPEYGMVSRMALPSYLSG